MFSVGVSRGRKLRQRSPGQVDIEPHLIGSCASAIGCGDGHAYQLKSGVRGPESDRVDQRRSRAAVIGNGECGRGNVVAAPSSKPPLRGEIGVDSDRGPARFQFHVVVAVTLCCRVGGAARRKCEFTAFAERGPS